MSTGKRIAWAALALILTGAYFSREKIFWSLGQALVESEAPRKADAVVVLGGDWRGNRILKAAELVKKGYATRVLVSGVSGLYGGYESDLAIDFAVKRGAPREAFVAAHDDVLSTSDEGRYDSEDLRRMGAHSVLLVTSEFHTRRAKRIFQRIAPEIEVHAIGAPDPYWDGGEWWKHREGRKTWLYESMKSVADLLGM